MTAVRDVGDISTDPGGTSGVDWTTRTRESVKALWELNGGRLLSVAGINDITGTVAVSNGFTAYGDGLRVGLVAAATNTGPVTLNISGIGQKAVRDPDGNVLLAGAIVAGRYTEVIFNAATDRFRLVTSGGTTEVTVQGGILLQTSEPARLVANTGTSTAQQVVASQAFQCLYAESRVIIEGNVSRAVGSGTADDDGVTVSLFVDGASAQSFTDYCQPSSHVNTPVSFYYDPGNTANHTYEIRVQSTLSSNYIRSATFIRCSEMSQNP